MTTLLNFPVLHCSNESDVEQKFLYPLLNHQTFLNIPAKAILTKRHIGSLPFVEKTVLPRQYIPDYLVVFSGLPVCVIEAKAPEVEVEKALWEAQTYANSLNAMFPTGINPISVAVGCNGSQIAVAPTDSLVAKIFSTSELVPGSASLEELRNLIGAASLSSAAKKIDRSGYRVGPFSIPARYLDSQIFLERVTPNSLAPYLNSLYEMFFRAEDPEKMQLILERAYVDTAELREYDQMLHSLLRQIERAHSDSYQTIQTDRRREYTLTPELKRYQSDKGPHGRLHLIIGSRGSGKTLFIARFFLHLMSENLKQKAAWFIIDFNRAPSSMENIEEYICEKFIEDSVNIGFDPYKIDNLNKVFSTELNRLKKGVFAGITDKAEKQRMLSTELLKLSEDKKKFATRIANFITGESGRPLIVAFDNVDRRESGQQLRIFQAAQWFRSETRAFALLTLRDVTFERFKNQPPLDTFAQINNFYVRPPRFSLVLQKRLSLAISEGLKELDEIEQMSESGLRFKYSKDHLSQFLRIVYDALFASGHDVGKIVDALAERDVREALGMFSRILASGHFNADAVIGMGTGGSDKISNDLLIKILMRSDYRLYSEGSGFIQNLFRMPEGFSGNIFLNVEILGFFARAESGIDNVSGFWRLEELISDLMSMGFMDDEIRNGVQSLLDKKLLIFDGENSENPSDEDLIKIAPSGFIHLRSLPYFTEYLSSAALQTKMTDGEMARRISQIWANTIRLKDLNSIGKLEVSSLFVNYLKAEKVRLDARNPLFRARCREAGNLVGELDKMISRAWKDAKKSRPSGLSKPAPKSGPSSRR